MQVKELPRQLLIDLSYFKKHGTMPCANTVYREDTDNRSGYMDEMKKLFDAMNLTEEEINLFLYGDRLQMDKLFMRPLAKLTYDLIMRP